ncbi:MAG: isoprenylcysteine carboxylmethyltransferase family protein [Alphaproteobacteria bacterium]|nr:isoprenylcysteine carboxylmethyltransferase family protein [Alphaproteobacteria bacterium]
MLSGFGGAALALLASYLLLFFWGSAMAAQAADRPIWLFGQASGRDRWAALGFRAAFALAFLGPLLWLVWPVLHKSDPFWTGGEAVALGLIGVFIAGTGAMLAFAAQMSMGSSWRIGVAKGATGAFVSGGLYQFSRNPTFVGQFLLLAGVGLAIPAVPTLLAPLLFLWSASAQVHSEESELKQALGADYSHYLTTVPRWFGLHRRTMP